MHKTLEITNLKVSIEKKEILKGINLSVGKGEIHVLMGPNGSGKSTLAMAVMGHPAYSITEGDVCFEGRSMTKDSTDKRAKKGLFLSFQSPREIPGVTLASFLRKAVGAVFEKEKETDLRTFMTSLTKTMKSLNIDSSFKSRYLNQGFSGGEKKKSEILQLTVLKPKIALLDEIDSGLDIDALREVAQGIKLAAKNKTGLLIVTHYQRILDYIKPDHVHIMLDGKIVKSGDASLVPKLEKLGYSWIREENK